MKTSLFILCFFLVNAIHAAPAPDADGLKWLEEQSRSRSNSSTSNSSTSPDSATRILSSWLTSKTEAAKSPRTKNPCGCQQSSHKK